MTKLEIIDSGVAQFTKRQKLVHLQETGVARSNNQDRYVFDSDAGIFAVADGVGGAPYGAEAAQAACRAFYEEILSENLEYISDTQSLALAQSSLAKIIHAAAVETTGYTTFTGIYQLDSRRYAYLHAGDSQLLIDNAGYTHHMTTIQNQAGNMLTNYMGGDGQHIIETAPHPRGESLYLTEWGVLDVRPGSTVILATDGVTEPTHHHAPTGEWWRAGIDRHNRASALARYLVRASPRVDDSTAIVIKFGEKE